MPRYKLYIEYDGSSYSGWQKQPNGSTVEEEIEKALSQRFQQPLDIIGQGRTDAGVHARGQVAHVDLPVAEKPEHLLNAFLGLLPRDIAVWKIENVAEDFHARFDAKSRSYQYRIVTRPSPLSERFAERVFEPLDWEAMKQCANLLLGTHSFESFTYSSPEQPSTECTISASEFEFDFPLITYHITANRFVRHMVRRLIGTMLQVAKGKRTISYFADLLHAPDSNKNGHGAPAKGLILQSVEY